MRTIGVLGEETILCVHGNPYCCGFCGGPVDAEGQTKALRKLALVDGKLAWMPEKESNEHA